MKPELSEQERGSIYLASGFAHPALATEIAAEMNIELGNVEWRKHPNGEIYSRYGESVRGKHVFIVQSHVSGEGYSVNDATMQQCLLADAAMSSAATKITAVSPYLSYQRQDRKSKGREPIGARVILNQLAAAGVNGIVTVDMHSQSTQGIFQGQFDHLTAQPLLRRALRHVIRRI